MNHTNSLMHHDVLGMKWGVRRYQNSEYILTDGTFSAEDYLMHHGIKGMHWGIRRYQNPDGTLTAAGRQRYGTVENLNNRMTLKKQAKIERKAAKENDAAEENTANIDAAKREAIERGDADRVLELRGHMSTEELAEAIQRMKQLDEVAKYSETANTSKEKAEAKAARQQNIKAALDLGKSIAQVAVEKYKSISASAARDQAKAKAKTEKIQLKQKKLELKTKRVENKQKNREDSLRLAAKRALKESLFGKNKDKDSKQAVEKKDKSKKAESKQETKAAEQKAKSLLDRVTAINNKTTGLLSKTQQDIVGRDDKKIQGVWNSIGKGKETAKADTLRAKISSYDSKITKSRMKHAKTLVKDWMSNNNRSNLSVAALQGSVVNRDYDRFM